MSSCIVCRTPSLEFAEAYRTLPRVGSDSRPLPPGGSLGRCPVCGTIQKVMDDAFQAECEMIYSSYVMYGQSTQGTEPTVFDGRPDARSAKLVYALGKSMDLPDSGSLLDVGCGNGNLLRAFRAAHPGWELSGLELDDRHREAVEAVCGGGSLLTGELAGVAGTFDLITAMHVLEHLAEPVEFLGLIKDRLSSEGALVIQLPLWRENPFDLVVADHAVHYDAVSLLHVLDRGGFKPVFLSEEIVPRELTVIARPGKGPWDRGKAAGPGLDAALGWLAAVRDMAARAMESAGKNRFGIFGTGNAAMWLTGALGEAGFYVDDDPSRQGTNPMTGRPVYAPEATPEGSTVVICLPPELSAAIYQRVRRVPANWLVTPPLEQ
ncbi:methyltransferase domain-containing protein [Pseudodesulfovibrio cashew]|uniref:Methyltransferase domain-containing protein n=1 Tax=Pseudodesulfovibrio cashew TaxID=2678688 RepID=A0A6I6JFT0_9BACT|nr:class I SAM-dependent methyltransferase [Pseudodesulfovibrio cashew]QGY39373.1 methyltransferase domain-containing protein [Pseudodesulfovibrio cashew]